MTATGDYFYGNKISEYGKENGYVDYACLAKAFDAVLNNDIMSLTSEIGYWEQVSGYVDNSEEINELNEKIDNLSDLITDDSSEEHDKAIQNQISELEDKVNDLESEQDEQPDVYQWYIVDDSGADLLKECNEIVYYNETLDMYLWGVTHWGTSWDYVLTNIPIENDDSD